MHRRLVLSLMVALGLTLALGWVLDDRGTSALVDSNVLYVAPAGNCGTATPCYASIQTAVDAAIDGGEIRVAGGTYRGVNYREGVTQTIYVSKTVTLRGGYSIANWDTADPLANPTTIDAQGQGRVLYINGNISPTVEGLIITGGDAWQLGSTWQDQIGGGVLIRSATARLHDNRINGNAALLGGGVGLYHSAATLYGNTVYSNTTSAGGGGAGLYLRRSPATLRDNVIRDNMSSMTGDWGGGVYLSLSAAMLEDNTITDNRATTGGGLALESSDAILRNNTIRGNSANSGGGIYLSHEPATLLGNRVLENTAVEGAGAALWDCGGPLFVNTVLADNTISAPEGRGAGMHALKSSPHLLHTTLARNSGGDGSGVHVDNWEDGYSTVVMTNTIVVHQTVGISVAAGNSARLHTTLWYENSHNWAGAGAVDSVNGLRGLPMFAVDGFHLTASSAAIDRGVDSGVTVDIDGDPRPQARGYDLGADEFAGAPPVRFTSYLPVMLSTSQEGS